MTDKELLELAAKAAGISIIRSRLDNPLQKDFLIEGTSRNPYHENGAWNPLTDDGDALRLAVKIGLRDDIGCALYLADTEDTTTVFRKGANAKTEESGQCPYAATRRAIVRAAAEIGKTL